MMRQSWGNEWAICRKRLTKVSPAVVAFFQGPVGYGMKYVPACGNSTQPARSAP